MLPWATRCNADRSGAYRPAAPVPTNGMICVGCVA